jgi:hypothetical protein
MLLPLRYGNNRASFRHGRRRVTVMQARPGKEVMVKVRNALIVFATANNTQAIVVLNG